MQKEWQRSSKKKWHKKVVPRTATKRFGKKTEKKN